MYHGSTVCIHLQVCCSVALIGLIPLVTNTRLSDAKPISSCIGGWWVVEDTIWLWGVFIFPFLWYGLSIASCVQIVTVVTSMSVWLYFVGFLILQHNRNVSSDFYPLATKSAPLHCQIRNSILGFLWVVCHIFKFMQVLDSSDVVLPCWLSSSCRGAAIAIS
jgi:hypothetical protein